MAQARLRQISDQISPSRPVGVSQLATPDEHPYSVLEQPLGVARHVRVITIGAGASGLNMVRTLRKHLSNFQHVVYEKNCTVGGTWFENRYPGCKCDIPSHNYQFSWRPNPEWSSFFSTSEEIERYLSKVAAEEDLLSAIKFNHSVERAEWDHDRSVWLVDVKDLLAGKVYTDECHFLLNATGVLNNWKWPDIPDLHTFRGTLAHSANWPADFDFTSQKVAVIGNGSSGIQIVPEMQKSVNELVHFVRSPTWIAPPRLESLRIGNAGDVLRALDIDDEGNFSASQIAKFKEDPELYKRFVKAVEEEVNSNFPIMLRDGPEAQAATHIFRNYMESALQHDEKLCKALIPNFAVGCRRLTPGIGYLESLTASNVKVVTEEIARAVPNGLELISGAIVEVDAIVCATGFDVSFRPRFPIVGGSGNLQDIWSSSVPQSYMSCAVPGFPNYFMFLGPNAPSGHGSIFTIAEYVAKYIARVIHKCQTEAIKSITPKAQAVDDLAEHTRVFMPRTAWASTCRSWFKGGAENGPVTALHPGSRIHFFHMLSSFRGEDWDYEYERGANRFQYLGNGFSQWEQDGSDSTWYLNDPDKM